MECDEPDDCKERQSKHRKRKKERSTSSSSDSSGSLDVKLKEKLLKKLRKLRRKEKKKEKKKKKLKELKKKIKKNDKKSDIDKKDVGDSEKSKNFAPMTKEEWERQQSTLTRVYDAETGRTRLVRGSGEIVEECVSRERQRAINKQATVKDGEYFQKVLSSNLK